MMVVDVGGGSTELVRGRPTGPGAVSLQLGGTRQTERHLHHDPPLPEEVDALLARRGALVERRRSRRSADRRPRSAWRAR